MIDNTLHLILFFIQGMLIILIAPLFIGWIEQVKCWLQNRSAPSVMQLYYRIYKLFIKQPVLPENASWLFRTAPYLNFVCLAIICFALPFFMTSTLFSKTMDMIVLIGLLAMARIMLALAAMDVGTAFGSLGARRDMFVSCLAEPILLIIFYNIALLSGSPYISISSAYFIHHATLYPSMAFSLIALLLVSIAETGRMPIDNPATHLELTMIHEAMILEYSGRYLALIEWGSAIKLTLYVSFISVLFFPYGLSTNYQFSTVFIGLSSTIFKLFLSTAIIGFIESVNTKLRLFKVPDYLASAFMLAVLGVLITQLLEAS